MRPIDEKIVAMKMDISDFKRKATETGSLFGKLKNSLSSVGDTKGFGKIKEGLAGVQSAAQKVDMTTLATAVDTVAGRFGGLEVIAATALATITNKAVNAGLSLSKSLGMDQMVGGFQEYELKMGSIGTVLSNTEWDGTTLTDVNSALGELNEYSDQTIYNFAQMSQNVGRFTAAGVRLGDSTTAIKGLGNLAAISGSTTDQMNTAMYQMSQAMAAGKLNLMDWNSMTNAGMGGKKTQDALLATAKSMGIAVDTSDGFRNSIEQGWLTSEVFLATLKQFGDDESMTEAATKVRTFSQMMDTMKEGIGSGWATSWEIIFGDFEEATALWTGVSNFFGGFFEKQADARNALLRGIFDGGIVKTVFASLKNIASPLVAIFKAIGAGFKMAFPSIGVDRILSIADGIKNFTGKLKIGERSLNGITSIFGGFFSVLALGGKLIAGAFTFLFSLLPSFAPLGGALVQLGGLIGQIPLAINKALGSGEQFSGVLGVIQGAAMLLGMGLAAIVMGLVRLGEAVAEVFNILAFGDFTGIGPWAEDSVIVDKLFRIHEVLKDVVGGIIVAWNILAKGDFISGGPWAEDSEIVDRLFKIREGIYDVCNGIVSAWKILTKGDYSGGPWQKGDDIVQKLLGIRDNVKNIVGDIKDAFMGMFGSDEASAAGVDGQVVMHISKLDKVKIRLKNIVDDISEMNFSIEPVINGFSKFFDYLVEGFNNVKGVLSDIGGFIKKVMPSGESLLAGGIVATMIAIVGFVLKSVYDLKQAFQGWFEIGGSLSESLESIGGAFDAFALQFKAQALLTIGAAVVVLAIGFMLLATVDFEDIAKGLYAIIGGVGSLMIAMKIMDKYEIEGGGMGAVIQIVALSVAFSILAGAINKLAGLSWSEITKGLVGLIGVMGTFSIAIAIMGKFGGAKLGATALQFLGLAAAMHIMLSVVKKIAEVDTGSLVKGVTTLGIILLQMALFLKISAGSKFTVGDTLGILALGTAIKSIVSAVELIAGIDTKMLVKGLGVITIILGVVAAFAKLTSGTGILGASVGLVLLAGALLALTIPIRILGSMDTKTLAIGLGAIAVALVAIGLASKLMTGMVAAGIGIALLAAGLMLLLIPITAFGAMSWGVLLKGMTGLALTLAILGGAALLLAPAAIPLIAFGAAVALFGAGLALAGLGVSLFATALVTAAAMTGTAIITIVSMLGTLILGLTSLIPKAVEFVINVVHKMADAISREAPLLAIKMADMVLKMLKVAEEKVPEFVTAASNIVVKFLEGIEQEVPRVIVTFANMMLSIVEAVEVIGPVVQNAFLRLMAAVTRIMVSAGVATIDALFGWIPGVSKITAKIGETAEDKIVENFDSKQVADDKGKEFIDAMNAKVAETEKAGKNVAKAAEKGVDSANLKPIANDHGDDFSTGLASKAANAMTSGIKLGDSAESGADTADLSTIGTGHGTDFTTALASKATASNTSGKSLATAGKTGASSVDMTSAGANFGAGFRNGMSSQMESIRNKARDMAKTASNAVAHWLEIASPSRLMTRVGAFFGGGFAKGIGGKTKEVGSVAKKLATTAKKAVDEFIDGFELPDDDNELHFKAVVDYDTLDPNKFGRIAPVRVQPDTSFANAMATRANSYVRRPSVQESQPRSNEDSSKSNDPIVKQPAIIQIVTPDKREFAKWVVDDVTEFQEVKMATLRQF